VVAVTDTILFANNKIASLNNDVLSGDGSLVLAPGEGAGFPTPAAGQYFAVTLQNLSNGDIEVCYCTARSGDLLTVQRAQEGTIALGFPYSVSVVQMRLTKGILEKMLQVRFTAADVDKYLRVQASGLVTASAAEFQVPAGISYLANNETHTAGKATAPVLITAAAGGTVVLDCALSNAFEVTLQSNITLDYSNQQNGQTINVLLVQDASGGRTVTWATNKWHWPGGSAPTVSSGINDYDMISARYRTSNSRMCGVLLKDFA
jgi:hypothetical protein